MLMRFEAKTNYNVADIHHKRISITNVDDSTGPALRLCSIAPKTAKITSRNQNAVFGGAGVAPVTVPSTNSQTNVDECQPTENES
jgi:hypothetical protein